MSFVMELHRRCALISARPGSMRSQQSASAYLSATVSQRTHKLNATNRSSAMEHFITSSFLFEHEYESCAQHLPLSYARISASISVTKRREKREGRKRKESKQDTKRHTQGADPATQADTEHSTSLHPYVKVLHFQNHTTSNHRFTKHEVFAKRNVGEVSSFSRSNSCTWTCSMASYIDDLSSCNAATMMRQAVPTAGMLSFLQQPCISQCLFLPQSAVILIL
jgi:hypothetical protein